MVKFDGLIVSEEGLAYQKLHEDLPYEEKYYEISQFYIDTSRVESLGFCKPHRGRATCNVNTYNGDRFTVLFDMGKLAELVVKNKQQVSIMNYNN